MKEIKLTQGFVTKVDDADFEFLSKFKWQAKKRKDKNTVYAVSSIPLHKLLNPDYEFSDHWDGDGLNNQRDNLRDCTNSQNQANKGKPKRNKSGYKGVHFRPNRGNKYYATIGKDRQRIHIGCFDTAIEAAQAYDKRALALFGQFALLNFPVTEPVSKSNLTDGPAQAPVPRLVPRALGSQNVLLEAAFELMQEA